MDKQDLLTVLDQAIAALQAACKAHVGRTNNRNDSASSVILTSKQSNKPAAVKSGMREEGRQRVAEAQWKRWAKQKRATKKAARLAAK